MRVLAFATVLGVAASLALGAGARTFAATAARGDRPTALRPLGETLAPPATDGDRYLVEASAGGSLRVADLETGREAGYPLAAGEEAVSARDGLALLARAHDPSRAAPCGDAAILRLGSGQVTTLAPGSSAPSIWFDGYDDATDCPRSIGRYWVGFDRTNADASGGGGTGAVFLNWRDGAFDGGAPFSEGASRVGVDLDRSTPHELHLALPACRDGWAVAFDGRGLVRGHLTARRCADGSVLRRIQTGRAELGASTNRLVSWWSHSRRQIDEYDLLTKRHSVWRVPRRFATRFSLLTALPTPYGLVLSGRRSRTGPFTNYFAPIRR